MRISSLIICLTVFAQGIAVGTEKTRTPYDAIVVSEDGANVWSGPDAKKYYPTVRLNKGDHVKVVRIDPGGWCMIEPPTGSHSWVRAEYVDRDGTDRGFINTNRVKVHVGSEINPDSFLTYQAELFKDNPVEILGERVFTFDGEQPLRMLKIKPVKRESRWIKRRSIAAADSIKAEPFPSDESAPKRKNGPVADSEFDATTRPVSIGSTSPDDHPDTQSDDRNSTPRDRAGVQGPGKLRLAEIDREFHQMIQNEPPTWNLDALEAQYEQLDDDVGTPTMTAEVNRRLEAVKRYRKTYNDYADFLKLTSETKQRDAQILSQQVQTEAQLTSIPGQRPVTVAPEIQASLPPNTPPSAAQTNSSPAAQAATAAPQAAPTPAPQAQQQPGTPQNFDGAGIVTRLAKSFPGGPQFVLLAPDGKMLSILQPGPGIDLNRYAGRSMGIIGQRQRREDWNTDIIIVRGLQPVQLRGAR